MKTMIATLQNPVPTAMPEGNANQFAGFRMTLNRADGTGGTPSAIVQQLRWKFPGITEGATYSLTVEMVDTAGEVIKALPAVTIQAPSMVQDGHFVDVSGVAVEWEDAA